MNLKLKELYFDTGPSVLVFTVTSFLLASAQISYAQNILTSKSTTMRQASNLNLQSAGIEQFFMTGDGCRIAYQIDGQEGKPILVLSNSIATNFHMWDKQIPAFTKYFRVLRFDTRGNGASDAPAGDYSVDRMGFDVIELLDYLNISRVHFCGLSLGGFIGQWLGVHTPERIDKLILANTSSYLGPHNVWNDHITYLRKGGDMKKFGDMFINNWFPQNMLKNNDSTVSTFCNMVLATKPHGLAGSFAAVRDADMRRVIPLITNATLIIAGKYDSVTLPGHSEIITASIRGSKFIILPAVHLSHVEYQSDFEKLVIDFLLNR